MSDASEVLPRSPPTWPLARWMLVTPCNRSCSGQLSENSLPHVSLVMLLSWSSCCSCADGRSAFCPSSHTNSITMASAVASCTMAIPHCAGGFLIPFGPCRASVSTPTCWCFLELSSLKAASGPMTTQAPRSQEALRSKSKWPLSTITRFSVQQVGGCALLSACSTCRNVHAGAPRVGTMLCIAAR